MQKNIRPCLINRFFDNLMTKFYILWQNVFVSFDNHFHFEQFTELILQLEFDSVKSRDYPLLRPHKLAKRSTKGTYNHGLDRTDDDLTGQSLPK